jgi:long-chain fatty acid transport protein
MRSFHKRQLIFFTAALNGLMPEMASAAGYYLPNQDAFATARGNAFVATADSAAAVFYNPAGMTQLEAPQAQVGVYSIVLGNTATVKGEKTEAEREIQMVPSLYYVMPLNDRLSFGFGVNSPYGLGTDWGRHSNMSPVVTETRLLFASTTSAVSELCESDAGAGVEGSWNRSCHSRQLLPLQGR